MHRSVGDPFSNERAARLVALLGAVVLSACTQSLRGDSEGPGGRGSGTSTEASTSSGLAGHSTSSTSGVGGALGAGGAGDGGSNEGGGQGGGGGAVSKPIASSVVVTLIPDNVVTAQVDVTTIGAASAYVEYGDTTAYGTSTPAATVADPGTATFVLLGLTEGAENHARVVCRAADGTIATGQDIVFRTLPFPPNLFPSKKLEVDTGITNGTVGGYILTDLSTPAGRSVVMIDRTGRVMWYHRVGKRGPKKFIQLPNQHFLFNYGSGRFQEYDLASNFIREWTAPTSLAPEGLNGHEFIYLPASDHAYVFAQVKYPADTTSIGGTPNSHRQDTNLLELDGQGGAKLIWASHGVIDLDELVVQDKGLKINPKNVDLIHPNSIEPDPSDGTLILSLRDLSSAIKIDPTNGDIIWRLGGTKSDFTFVGDPLGQFWSQHDVRLTPQGTIRIYDNGNNHSPALTRPVEYKLDLVAHTATFATDYLHDPPLFSPICGGARQLPNGNELVTYFHEGTLTEFDTNHQVVWELNYKNVGAYRAEWLPTLYPPPVP